MDHDARATVVAGSATATNGVVTFPPRSTTLALLAQAFIGLSVTSHDPGVATTATFTNVSVTQPEIDS